MLSRRALGIFALVAVILAAISFAVVDVSIATADGCAGVSGPCADDTMPYVATVFASIGTVSLLLSVLPAISWFIGAIDHPHHDVDIEPVRLARVNFHEEEL